MFVLFEERFISTQQMEISLFLSRILCEGEGEGNGDLFFPLDKKFLHVF